MSAFHSNMLLGSVNTADLGDQIDQSLRFRGAQHLQRNQADLSSFSADQTWSLWIKPALKAPAVNSSIFNYQSNWLMFNLPDTQNYLRLDQSGSTYPYTDLMCRDPSAWYHFLISSDAAANITKIWVNGELRKTNSNKLAAGAPSSNMIVGGQVPTGGARYYVGYKADVHFIDGQALDPTTFGRFNADGIWVPVDPKKDGDTTWYGANGFHLTFADPTNVGKDYSGNGNDFTATGFDTTNQASSTYDIMQDSPTNNFATGNPLLAPNNMTLSDANLTATGATTTTTLTTQLPAGKVYWEAIGSNYYYGLAPFDTVRNSYLGSQADQIGWYFDGSFWQSGVNVGYLGPAFGTTDIAMQAYDPATGEYWVGKNGTWYNGSNPAAGTGAAWTVSAQLRDKVVPAFNNAAATVSFNLGQQPFVYTPPTGFKPLSTANLEAPTISNGRDHFQAITDTGANILTAAQAAFPSGLWWIKDRANANQHQLVDVVNGISDVWQSPAGTGGNAYTPPTGNSVAWCWKAGDSAVANTDGTIASTVRANPDAGFSIVQWTGTQTAGSVGHGLNGTPDYIIGVGYTGGLLPVWNSAATPAAGYFYLNTGGGWTTNQDIWNSAQMSATTIGVSSSTITNQTGELMTAYVWTAIPGYSAFGSYSGNSNADGPFVYLGFRPAFVMFKTITATNWSIQDSTRYPSNPTGVDLVPNSNASENQLGAMPVDFLSNGFKVRTGNANTNSSTVVYAAFAENPFGGENIAPVPAH